MERRVPHSHRKLRFGQQRIIDMICERVSYSSDEEAWWPSACALAKSIDPTRKVGFRVALKLMLGDNFLLFLNDEVFWRPPTMTTREDIDKALDLVAKAVDSRGVGLSRALQDLEAAIRADERALCINDIREDADEADETSFEPNGIHQAADRLLCRVVRRGDIAEES